MRLVVVVRWVFIIGVHLVIAVPTIMVHLTMAGRIILAMSRMHVFHHGMTRHHHFALIIIHGRHGFTVVIRGVSIVHP